jgi:hypothetical protein
MKPTDKQIYDQIFEKIVSQEAREVKPGGNKKFETEPVKLNAGKAVPNADKVHRMLLLHLGLIKSKANLRLVNDSPEF